MAVRKTNKEEVTEEVIEKKETPVTVRSPKKQKRKLILPKLRGRHAENTVFVGVNGKNYLIKRGVEVEVDDAVYDILMQSQEAEEIADAYIEKATDPNNKGMEF